MVNVKKLRNSQNTKNFIKAKKPHPLLKDVLTTHKRKQRASMNIHSSRPALNTQFLDIRTDVEIKPCGEVGMRG